MPMAGPPAQKTKAAIFSSKGWAEVLWAVQILFRIHSPWLFS